MTKLKNTGLNHTEFFQESLVGYSHSVSTYYIASTSHDPIESSPQPEVEFDLHKKDGGHRA